jgi:hypothetical protein
MTARTRDFGEIPEGKRRVRPAAVSPNRQRCRKGVTCQAIAVEFATCSRLRRRGGFETTRGGGVLPVGAEGLTGAAIQDRTLRYRLARHML